MTASKFEMKTLIVAAALLATTTVGTFLIVNWESEDPVDAAVRQVAVAQACMQLPFSKISRCMDQATAELNRLTAKLEQSKWGADDRQRIRNLAR